MKNVLIFVAGAIVMLLLASSIIYLIRHAPEWAPKACAIALVAIAGRTIAIEMWGE